MFLYGNNYEYIVTTRRQPISQMFLTLKKKKLQSNPLHLPTDTSMSEDILTSPNKKCVFCAKIALFIKMSNLLKYDEMSFRWSLTDPLIYL